MGYEAPEWPRSNLGSFELGAPDPTYITENLERRSTHSRNHPKSKQQLTQRAKHVPKTFLRNPTQISITNIKGQ
jgi:hypothetical protein